MPDWGLIGTEDGAAIVNILQEVFRERELQHEKWGLQSHEDPIWLAILGEEFGEACTAALPKKCGGNGHLRSELIQVAAVAVAHIEAIDRRNSGLCGTIMGWGPCKLPRGHKGRHAKANPPLYVQQQRRLDRASKCGRCGGDDCSPDYCKRISPDGCRGIQKG